MNGLKLKELREDKEVYQKELAAYLMISPSTVGMYENGRREPDNQTLKKIANFFEVPVDYLLDNERAEMDMIKTYLRRIGYLKENENFTREDLNKLNKFIIINKEYINK